MEQIDIRVAGEDEQSVRRLCAELSVLFPGATFGRPRIGRKGDWICDGWIDEGAMPLDSGPRYIRHAFGWLLAYRAMREEIMLRLGEHHPALRRLDRAVDTVLPLVRWEASGRRGR